MAAVSATRARAITRLAGASLALIAATAFALRVTAALLLPNTLWPDEIFQSVEQAHRLVFGYGVIPWEFRVGARSWLLPGLLGGVVKVASLLSDHPAVYLGAITLVLSALSLVLVIAAWYLAARDYGASKALVAAACVAAWFEFVYMAPKALGEVVAAHLLVAAVALFERPDRRQRVAAAGVLAGLAVAFRIQLAPAVVVFLATATIRSRRTLAVAAGGMCAALIAVGVLDWVTWGAPFHSYWTNVRVNLVEGKSAFYGVLPWYAYATMLRGVWGVWALPIGALAGAAARRRPAAFACAVTILLTHAVIPHKEWRFIYPASALLVLLASVGTVTTLEWVAQRRGSFRGWAIGAVGAWAVASTVLAIGFDSDATLQADGGRLSHWKGGAAVLAAERVVSQDASICGVALVGIPWAFTGGYSWLHRDLPLFLPNSSEEREQLQTFYNVSIARIPLGAKDVISAAQNCWRDRGHAICVFKRDGPCAAFPGYSINRVLESRAE